MTERFFFAPILAVVSYWLNDCVDLLLFFVVSLPFAAWGVPGYPRHKLFAFVFSVLKEFHVGVVDYLWKLNNLISRLPDRSSGNRGSSSEYY